jgi:glycosyltransferase involved in cell wall biosynthesis
LATRRQLRAVFLAGPGDAHHTFKEWKEGRVDRKSSHVTYSSQFYDACRELDISALVLTSNAHAQDDPLSDGRITLEWRPDLLAGQRKLRYQARQWAYARSVIRDVRRSNANLLVTADQPHLFLFTGLKARGVSIVQVLQCTLWPPHAPRSPVSRATMGLLGLAYPTVCDAVLSASDEINRQVRSTAARVGRTAPPIANFMPHYRPEMYGGLPPPQRGPVVRFMFVGRIEADKGVFNLLEIAGRLRDKGRNDIAFELCGSGTALEELRARTAERKLETTFVINGWCDHQQLRDVYQRSYAVVVPTTVNFVEGFNQVVVEALLAGRPVITSNVCPAVEYVAPAVLQVPPDDLAAYEQAILRLADEPATYERLRAACAPICRQFLDPETSFRRALVHALSAIAEGRPMAPRLLPASYADLATQPAATGAARAGASSGSLG